MRDIVAYLGDLAKIHVGSLAVAEVSLEDVFPVAVDDAPEVLDAEQLLVRLAHINYAHG
jgi:hypothetical protein